MEKNHWAMAKGYVRDQGYQKKGSDFDTKTSFFVKKEGNGTRRS